jgi:hypothetical protein
VLFEDWREKVPDEFAVCPKCGQKSDPSNFNAPWQQQYINDFAHAYMLQRLNDAFSQAARRTRTRRTKRGLLTWCFHRPPPRRFGRISHAIPANAGTHNWSWLLLPCLRTQFSTKGDKLPDATELLAETQRMG